MEQLCHFRTDESEFVFLSSSDLGNEIQKTGERPFHSGDTLSNSITIYM